QTETQVSPPPSNSATSSASVPSRSAPTTTAGAVRSTPPPARPRAAASRPTTTAGLPPNWPRAPTAAPSADPRRHPRSTRDRLAAARLRPRPHRLGRDQVPRHPPVGRRRDRAVRLLALAHRPRPGHRVRHPLRSRRRQRQPRLSQRPHTKETCRVPSQAARRSARPEHHHAHPAGPRPGSGSLGRPPDHSIRERRRRSGRRRGRRGRRPHRAPGRGRRLGYLRGRRRRRPALPRQQHEQALTGRRGGNKPPSIPPPRGRPSSLPKQPKGSPIITRQTPPPLAELSMLASLGTLPELARQLSGLGGCTHPVRLDGHRTEYAVDTTTGEVGRVLHLDSTALPAGSLLVRCNNRRATRCRACAEVYRRDTYHLITAGLRGGKGTPEQVGTHPRVFATFTAPSFGPVHNRPSNGRPCRCGVRHDETDPVLGTPLDPDTYDYAEAVLWTAHAGALWRRFSIYLRREVAKLAGLTQRAFRDHARISFAKVAEYQKRGAVHFHAV